jgi:hypothetical protein
VEPAPVPVLGELPHAVAQRLKFGHSCSIPRLPRAARVVPRANHGIFPERDADLQTSRPGAG